MLVEQLTQLQIPVLAFQERDLSNIHRAPTTSKRLFQNFVSWNDWIGEAYGTSKEYNALWGKLTGKQQGLFKIDDSGNDGEVYWLPLVQLLQASQNEGGRIADAHGLVTVFAKY